MKKNRITGIGILSFTALLAACGNQSDSGESVEEIVKQSQEVMHELESYAVEMNMTQHMGMGEDSEEAMVIHSESFMDITLDPMTFKQEMVMDLNEMGGLAGGNADETEMSYLSYFHEENGLFVEDPAMGTWMKFPDSYLDDVLAMSEMQMNPQEQLQFLEQYMTELSLEEDEEYYHITLMTEDIQMEELMEALQGLDADAPGVEGMDELFGMMELKELDYSITIAKDSYYQTEGTMNMIMSMDMMGQNITTEQKTHMIMSQFNGIEPVSVPQDVLDSAEEMDDIHGVPGM